jgi:hypothetical protein
MHNTASFLINNKKNVRSDGAIQLKARSSAPATQAKHTERLKLEFPHRNVMLFYEFR